MKVDSEKVAAYITWQNRLLIFRQPGAPEAGVQVPAGTMEADEDPYQAVLREAQEETGLSDLQVGAYLGRSDLTFEDAQGMARTVRRHFFHLRYDGDAPARWQHWEMTPSGGVEGPILFELWWAPLEEASRLLNGWFTIYLDQLQI